MDLVTDTPLGSPDLFHEPLEFAIIFRLKNLAPSPELTTFALVHWRSAYVPRGKAESARALPSRIRSVLRHRRKRSQKLGGINCVAATIQLTGREPATFDCPVDRKFGNACGPCCAVWCVHSALPMRCAKNLLLSFPCSR
jgi:hypothetical protein